MASDLKQYAQDLFKKAGVPKDKMDAILEALGDDTVQKAFKEGFVETPTHHSEFDRFKGEQTRAREAAEQEASRLKEWYSKEAQPAYEQVKANWNALQEYQRLYGPIETPGQQRAAAAAVGLTKEQVDEMVKAEQNQMAARTVGLVKDVAYVTTDYLQRFKEPVDLDALEAAALKSGLPLRQAYKEFISDKVEAQRTVEFEAKLKAAREEGARDALSKHKLPVDSKPSEPHPFYDQTETPKEMNEQQQERHSKEAFLEAWNNYGAGPTGAQ